jgi:hypothetical protein
MDRSVNAGRLRGFPAGRAAIAFISAVVLVGAPMAAAQPGPQREIRNVRAAGELCGVEPIKCVDATGPGTITLEVAEAVARTYHASVGIGVHAPHVPGHHVRRVRAWPGQDWNRLLAEAGHGLLPRRAEMMSVVARGRSSRPAWLAVALLGTLIWAGGCGGGSPDSSPAAWQDLKAIEVPRTVSDPIEQHCSRGASGRAAAEDGPARRTGATGAISSGHHRKEVVRIA